MSLVQILLSILILCGLGIFFSLIYMVSIKDLPNTSPASKSLVSRSGLRAVIACAGPEASPLFYHYKGFSDCRIVHTLFSGDRHCRDACLGYGTCVDVCPRSAISLTDKGLPIVSEDCDGCGICVGECPMGTIKLVPRNADYYICCSSHLLPEERPGFCPSACTACHLCEKLSPSGGFSIKAGIAVINYKLGGDRTEASRQCPSSCIVSLSPVIQDKNAFQEEKNHLELVDRKSGATDIHT